MPGFVRTITMQQQSKDVGGQEQRGTQWRAVWTFCFSWISYLRTDAEREAEETKSQLLPLLPHAFGLMDSGFLEQVPAPDLIPVWQSSQETSPPARPSPAQRSKSCCCYRHRGKTLKSWGPKERLYPRPPHTYSSPCRLISCI